MTNIHKLISATFIFALLGSAAGAQQSPESVPDGTFETVHLLTVMSSQEASLSVAVREFNRTFANQGCSTCAYHLFKLFNANGGKYTHMMTADWPGRAAYTKIHASAAYAATAKKNPVMSELESTEFYGRYVEVK